MDEIRSDNTGEASDDSAEIPSKPKRTFEDLSLLEMLPWLLRHPWLTLGTIGGISRRRIEKRGETEAIDESIVVEDTRLFSRDLMLAFDWRAFRPVLGIGAAMLLAVVGSFILTSSAGSDNPRSLAVGGIPLIIGGVWMAVLAARNIQWQRLPALEALPAGDHVSDMRDFLEINGLRVALFVICIIWTVGAWVLNTDPLNPANRFTAIGTFCWVMSMLTMTGVLIDRELYIGKWINRQIVRLRELPAKRFNFGIPWTAIALAIILIVGAGYRFGDLSSYPPDMTSDHVEKLLDSIKIYEGQRPIFLPNNGGREVFQMYYLAALKSATGQPFSFELLKFGTGLEGMVMILLAFWMGRAVIGDEDRRLGNLTGLVMAALIATSYWHTLLSRLGLRIVLTTLITAVVFVFLTRALRHNRRTDYLITGFALGAGMYFYQAVRMLPLVIVAGFILALFIRARSRHVARQYTMNLIALILMALVVFVPLAHYAVVNPDSFFQRTLTRLMGEAERKDEATGQMVEVPFNERLETFKQNLPGITDNLVRSALMFNWRGDRAWFNGSPDGAPALDFFTGALFVLGLGVIAIRIWKRRDPVDALLPISILIMLLPSALAVAFTIEVPSFTRGSGALPMVYFVAALGLAVVIGLIARRVRPGWPQYLIYAVLLVLFVMGAMANSTTYFVDAMNEYRASSLPHRQAGQILRGFIDSTGAPGNAFMISYEYWWDHRALGIESGDPKWPNTIALRDDIKAYILRLMSDNATTRYAVKPNRQLLFFLNQADATGLAIVQEMFPDGSVIKVPSYNATRDFILYVVPPVQCDWLRANLTGDIPDCPADVQTPSLPGAEPTPGS